MQATPQVNIPDALCGYQEIHLRVPSALAVQDVGEAETCSEFRSISVNRTERRGQGSSNGLGPGARDGRKNVGLRRDGGVHSAPGEAVRLLGAKFMDGIRTLVRRN